MVVPGGGWDCSRARAGAWRPEERVSSLPGKRSCYSLCLGFPLYVAPETMGNVDVVD